MPGARRLLLLDGTGMAVVGAGYLAGAAPLGRVLGPATGTVALVGAVLLVLGAAVALAARPPEAAPGTVRWVVACGAGWIALSAAVLAFDVFGAGVLDLTAAGAVWTAAQTVPVGVFAALQYAALRRAAPPAGRG
ncbi:hypothetical protein CUT44_12490 [Streptomyces carminius]|uniref:Integral membrane protein n=1 Tax=Streptomyces carminius TaxID=2665496 RepID=A0A2M8LZV9_9ACTN|nr:hypothetical protein CUT44_12490 [Streptomyces carminius]